MPSRKLPGRELPVAARHGVTPDHVAAVAALQEHEEVTRRAARSVAERDRVTREPRALGYGLPDSPFRTAAEDSRPGQRRQKVAEIR
ncbi:hypothetical protein [Nonomuraea sp. NPDC049709]|uniref:hypothetical protein n=1 Tax=Nonomuraea sp. NPDC049709 TaxID=3154736 RepID=UPI003412F19C